MRQANSVSFSLFFAVSLFAVACSNDAQNTAKSTKLVIEGKPGAESSVQTTSVGKADVSVQSESDVKDSVSIEMDKAAEPSNAEIGELKQYGAPVGDPAVIAIGLAGLERARAAGVKDEEIKDYARLHNVFFGEKALEALGLNQYILKQYGDGVAIGLVALERARAAGLKDSEILIYAKLQNILFGENALKALGQNKYVLSQYGAPVGDPAVTSIGLAGLERARAAGLKDSEVQAYAKLQNIVFGEKALASLGM